MTHAATVVTQSSPVRISPLRDELKLHDGPFDTSGSPTWTLEDPFRDRYFRIGPAEVEMLAHWDQGSPNDIAQAIRETGASQVEAEDVEGFARFLAGSNLLKIHGHEANARLARQLASLKMGWGKWLLKNYLFVRIPLVRPSKFLKATLPLVQPFFSLAFLWLTLACGLLGLGLVSRQWDTFQHTFLHFFTLEGAALAALTLFLSKILHELGHAYTATRAGCRVGTMGVALLVMWPVLYTDTSGAWKLKNRSRRLGIGAAGMAVELTLACYATLAWSFLPDGTLRSAAFTLATTTWLLTLAVNLNPFMRFDGYYLLSDALDIANLQDRSFRLARWRLREAMFGLGEPKPESFGIKRERLLLVYAYSVWIYRFFLFLGIALLVYHVFFKLLGLFLFAVEIGWFLVRPIVMEIKEWLKRREAYRWNRNTFLLAGTAALIVTCLVLPWDARIDAPALLRAEQQTQLYAPAGGRLAEILIKPGSTVTAGQPLYRFAAPDLDHELDSIEREILILGWQSNFQILNQDRAAGLMVVRNALESALARRGALKQEMTRLTVTAPFDGVLADAADPLNVEEYLAKGEWLGTLVGASGAAVDAYVGEDELSRLKPGSEATFKPEDSSRAEVRLTLHEISTTATRKLNSSPELGSPYGGRIAALADREGALVPEQSVYRLALMPTDLSSSPVMALRGRVVIKGEAESIISKTLRLTISVIIRETGF